MHSPPAVDDDLRSVDSTSREPPRKKRNRSTRACRTCRTKRTKCDAQDPCGHCLAHHLHCEYDNAPAHPSPVEHQLAAINQRLDWISSRLHQDTPHQDTPQQPRSVPAWSVPSGRPTREVSDEEKLPFQLLGSEHMMAVLGLEAGFARRLLTLERAASPLVFGASNRLRIIQQSQALAALAAFSSKVHVWYPILRPGFSERYLHIVSGPLAAGPESGLGLLVAAIGFLAMRDSSGDTRQLETPSESFLEAATVSLPLIVVDDSLESVQCLILLGIYHCCLSKPCHALDYVMIASFKVQNLLKAPDETAGELHEHLKRAFWAILLLESELRVQFDVVESGIWDHDDTVALPDSRRAWQFDLEAGSPLTMTSPASAVSLSSAATDRAQAYFLAAISMRRMLHRCNTAIRRTPQGDIVYASAIASELELQLDEWYTYLPDVIRFDKEQDLDFDLLASPSLYPPMDPLSSFLRVQYYCCKISIYWPAVYQIIQYRTASIELLQDCRRFFDAYIQVIPSILMSVRDCMVNRWTLYASIFMTSLATMRAMEATQALCISQGCEVDWFRVSRCLESTARIDSRFTDASPSLSLLAGTLAQKHADFRRTAPLL